MPGPSFQKLAAKVGDDAKTQGNTIGSIDWGTEGEVGGEHAMRETDGGQTGRLPIRSHTMSATDQISFKAYVDL